MSKKLFIYGLAFASPVAAAVYLYFSRHLYTSDNARLIFMLIKEVLIPAIAIVLFLLSLKRDDPAAFTMGRGIFGGFILSVIVSCGGTIMFAYLLRYQPELINVSKQYAVDTVKRIAASGVKLSQPLPDIIKNVESQYTYGQQFVTAVSMAGSVGLFVGGIMSYIIRPKAPKA